MTQQDFPQTEAEQTQRAGTEAGPRPLLGFESGGEYWLVDLAAVGEVLPVPALVGVPLTKPWFRGIANIRGTLYSVTDLAAFHGFDPTPATLQTRLLLAGPRGGNAALLVSGTQGLKALATLEAMPAHTPAQPWHGARYRDSSGRTWTHLLLPVLLGASEFLNIAT